MVTFDKIIELLEAKHLSQKELADYLGVGKNRITDWKSGRIKSYTKYLPQIAEFLGVSIDGLMGREEQKSAKGDRLYFLSRRNVYLIPLFESASAGFGTLPDERIVDYVPCYITSQSEANMTICIKVSGDSMYPKIEDGDTIQVLKQSTADNGSIAVLLIDGEEAVVKKVEYGDGCMKLISINPLYPPKIFKGADLLRVQILGVVKKIIKVV